MSSNQTLAASLSPEEQTNLLEALMSDVSVNRVPQVGDVLEGTVVSMGKGEVLVDYGGKSEAVIQGRELIDLSEDASEEEMKEGDTVLAIVLRQEDTEGRAVLSIRRARAEKKWREMHDKFENKEPVRLMVVQPNKGGLIVNAEGLQGFVPISQLGPQHYPSSIQKGPGFADAAIAYLTKFVGEEFEAQIIEFERETNRLILSERILLERTQGLDPTEELNFKVGDEMEGSVVAIKDFGIFVDLGTTSGLVHISEMSWDRINHPGDLMKIGDMAKVKVIGIEEGGRRVSLSIKQLSMNPWQAIADKYNIGDVVPGQVTKIVDYGAFIQLELGFDGLVHISELSPFHVKDPADILQEGQEDNFKIILLDKDAQRLGLSYRQANPQHFMEGGKFFKQAPQSSHRPDSEGEEEGAEMGEAAATIEPKEATSVVEASAVETTPVEEKSTAPKVDKDTAVAELEKLEGVGPAMAEKLYDAGYDGIQAVADATPAQLSLIPGVRMATAEKLLKNAQELS